MIDSLNKLLKEAKQQEKKQDYDKLAQTFCEIAKLYYPKDDLAKNEHYLSLSREAKEKIQAPAPILNEPLDIELLKIVDIPDSEEKLLLMEQFKDKHPKFARVYYVLGVLSNNLEKYEKARSFYELFIKTAAKNDNKNKAYTYNNLANLLVNDYFKEYDLAKKNYELAIELNPKYLEAYNNLAALLSNEYFKEYDLAKKNYEISIELSPQDFKAYHNLAVLYFQNFRDKEKSDFYFAKAIEVNKDSIFTRNVLANTIKEIPFLTKIDIQKLRHIKDLKIEIDKEQQKHLLITGTNGSGKSTILDECKNFLHKLLETPIDQLFTEKSRNEIFFPKEYTLRMNFSTERLTDIRLAYESGIFVVKYLGANTGRKGDRGLNPEGVEKIDKIELPFINKIAENLADKMVAYLVDLDYTRLRAYRNKEEEKYKEIDLWFENFLKILQSFDDQIVDLKYSDSGNTHNFILKVKSPADPNEIIDVKFIEMPDGFKAAFKIVFEILLQMQSKVTTTYNLPGIVMIDEPELFLHIRLQKKILPALTTLFPNIQFIVATHSPFVLSSISNAVIYDLETKNRLTDLTRYSVDNIIETYFETDRYSKQLIDKLTEYEKLSLGENLKDEEISKLKKLTTYFTDFYDDFSDEIQVKLQQIKLSKLGR